VGLWLAAHAPGDAQEPAHALAAMEWQLGPCGERPPELAEEVEAQLRRRVFVAPERAQLHIQGRIRRRGERLVARFAMRRGGRLVGTRELVTASCQELRRALPIVLALAVDLDLRSVRLELPARPSGTLSADAQEPASGEDPRERSDEDARPAPNESEHPFHAAVPSARADRATVGMRAGAAFDLGLLPSHTYAPRLALRLETSPLPPLELRGAVLLPAREAHDGRGVDFWGGLVGVASCPGLRRTRRWIVEICAGAEAGAVHARGRGFAVNRSARAALVDVFAGLRVAARFAHLGLSIELAATVPLPASEFTVTSLDGSESVVSEGAPVGGRLVLAIAAGAAQGQRAGGRR